MAVASYLGKFDVIHSVGMDFAGLVAANWAKRAGIGHVVQVTGSDLNAKDGRMTSIVRSSPWVHAVACNSDALVREFRQRYPEFRNVQRVWRGVDLTAFRPMVPRGGHKQPEELSFCISEGCQPAANYLIRKTLKAVRL